MMPYDFHSILLLFPYFMVLREHGNCSTKNALTGADKNNLNPLQNASTNCVISDVCEKRRENDDDDSGKRHIYDPNCAATDNNRTI